MDIHLTTALIRFAVFLFSTTVHEARHALVAGPVFSISLPENLGRQVREFRRNGALSMVGLFVAWRIFPLVSDPLFAAVLALVHPGTSYE